jgi:hypothetical protein
MESVNVITSLVLSVKCTRRKELLRKRSFHWPMFCCKQAKPRTLYPSSGIETVSSCSWNSWNNTVMWKQKFDKYLWDRTQAILRRCTKSPYCFTCKRVQCLLETHTAWRMRSSGMWRCVDNVQPAECSYLLTLVLRLRNFIKYPEDGGDTFLRSVGLHNIYTAPHPGRRIFS